MNDCKTWACAQKGCQSVIHLHHDVEAKLRRTHESFYCPAGHSNYFGGKTSEQKKIGQLEKERDRWFRRYEDALEERDDWKLQAKSCPFGCGYRVARKSKPENIDAMLVMHLIEVHEAVLPVAEHAEAL